MGGWGSSRCTEAVGVGDVPPLPPLQVGDEQPWEGDSLPEQSGSGKGWHPLSSVRAHLAHSQKRWG